MQKSLLCGPYFSFFYPETWLKRWFCEEVGLYYSTYWHATQLLPEITHQTAPGVKRSWMSYYGTVYYSKRETTFWRNWTEVGQDVHLSSIKREEAFQSSSCSNLLWFGEQLTTRQRSMWSNIQHTWQPITRQQSR